MFVTSPNVTVRTRLAAHWLANISMLWMEPHDFVTILGY